jgi:Ser/Thr protein kinase RdoA (MazF antagonist)
MEQSVSDLLRPEHLEQAKALWGKPGAELKLLGDVENFVYDLSSAGSSDAILRITHSSHRSADLVHGEMEWIQYLSDYGISVARPVRSASGNLLEVINAGNSYFLVTAFEKAPGTKASTKDPQVWNTEFFRRYGQITGKLHAATKLYTPSSPKIKRPEWYEEDMLASVGRYIPKESTFFWSAYNESMHWMNGLSKDKESYGLVHTDLHNNNFFVDGERITVFDFDDCSYQWFAYDIAMIIYYSFPVARYTDETKGKKLMQDFFVPFIEGYNSQNELDAKWVATIPDFMKFRDLIMYLFCYKKFPLQSMTENQKRFMDDREFAIKAGVSSIWFDPNVL